MTNEKFKFQLGISFRLWRKNGCEKRINGDMRNAKTFRWYLVSEMPLPLHFFPKFTELNDTSLFYDE
jgi:hypothetical protein